MLQRGIGGLQEAAVGFIYMDRMLVRMLDSGTAEGQEKNRRPSGFAGILRETRNA